MTNVEHLLCPIPIEFLRSDAVNARILCVTSLFVVSVYCIYIHQTMVDQNVKYVQICHVLGIYRILA